jgi:hypothetical protein
VVNDVDLAFEQHDQVVTPLTLGEQQSPEADPGLVAVAA